MQLEKTYQAAAYGKPYSAAPVEKEGKSGAENAGKPGVVTGKPAETWSAKDAKPKDMGKTEAYVAKTDTWAPPAKTAMAESVLTAKMADYLTEKVPAALPGAALVKEIVARLDSDGSYTLNSEEIAGTRLAEKIGDGFYKLDADKTGTLDMYELGEFLRGIASGLAEEMAPAAGPAPEAPTAGAAAPAQPTAPAVSAESDALAATTLASVAPAEETGAAEEVAAAAEVAEGEPSAAASAAERVRLAFEAALQMIRDGQETRSTYDVVSALYGTTRGILAP